MLRLFLYSALNFFGARAWRVVVISWRFFLRQEEGLTTVIADSMVVDVEASRVDLKKKNIV